MKEWWKNVHACSAVLIIVVVLPHPTGYFEQTRCISCACGGGSGGGLGALFAAETLKREKKEKKKHKNHPWPIVHV